MDERLLISGQPLVLEANALVSSGQFSGSLHGQGLLDVLRLESFICGNCILEVENIVARAPHIDHADRGVRVYQLRKFKTYEAQDHCLIQKVLHKINIFDLLPSFGIIEGGHATVQFPFEIYSEQLTCL